MKKRFLIAGGLAALFGIIRPDSVVVNNRLTRESILDKYEKEASSGALEDEIEKTWPVKIWGGYDEKALRAIQQSLKLMPVVDLCEVYVLPKQIEARFLLDEKVNGFYESAYLGYPAHIVLFSTDIRTITHEFMHNRAAVLGESFEEKWAKTNAKPYGLVEFDKDLGYVWKDERHNFMKSGFCEAYGDKNVHEDIATMATFVQHDLNSLYLLQFSIDAESATIFSSKINLLKEGRFIHASEAERAKKYLDQERIKKDLARLWGVGYTNKPESITFDGGWPIHTSTNLEVWAQAKYGKKCIRIVYDPEHKGRERSEPLYLDLQRAVMRLNVDADVPDKYRRFLPQKFIDWFAEVRKYTK